MDRFCPQKGGAHVVDDSRNTLNPMDAWACDGFTMGSGIHIIFAAAVALLVISLSQEAMMNKKLRHVLRCRGPKPDGKQRHERLADQPLPPQIMP